MTKQQIQALIEKYFAGETSLEEETILRQYFSGNQQVDDELKSYQPLFAFFHQAREEQLHPAFEARLVGKLSQQARPAARVRPLYPTVLRIAAAVVLLIGLYFLVPMTAPQQSEEPMAINWEKYEPASEELALEETKAALKLLASKLNRGAKTATTEINKMEKVTKPLK